MDSSDVILSLVGFIQVIFMFVLNRIFSAIDKQRTETKEDLRAYKKEQTTLLENHYVTTGQLNTLEEKVLGEIKNLSTQVSYLVDIKKREIENR